MNDLATKSRKRIPIALDEEILIKLRSCLEARLRKRMTVAAIVRLALQELLNNEVAE